jgi:hypothetical protein
VEFPLLVFLGLSRTDGTSEIAFPLTGEERRVRALGHALARAEPFEFVTAGLFGV